MKMLKQDLERLIKEEMLNEFFGGKKKKEKIANATADLQKAGLKYIQDFSNSPVGPFLEKGSKRGPYNVKGWEDPEGEYYSQVLGVDYTDKGLAHEPRMDDEKHEEMKKHYEALKSIREKWESVTGKQADNDNSPFDARYVAKAEAIPSFYLRNADDTRVGKFGFSEGKRIKVSKKALQKIIKEEVLNEFLGFGKKKKEKKAAAKAAAKEKIAAYISEFTGAPIGPFLKKGGGRPEYQDYSDDSKKWEKNLRNKEGLSEEEHASVVEQVKTIRDIIKEWESATGDYADDDKGVPLDIRALSTSIATAGLYLDYQKKHKNESIDFMKITKSQLRQIIKEQVKTWKERQAEMDAWEKKLVAVLPEDPSDLSDADITNIAQVFIDEYGLDQADGFFEDDRGTLADLGVPTYPDLEQIRMAISLAQDTARKANITKSPDKKELQAIDDGLEPREVEHLTYQPIRRGGKIVAFQIEDSETPWGTMPLGHSTFVVDERDAKAAGTTIDNIIKMLEKGGATLRKRRKPVKRTTPYYD